MRFELVTGKAFFVKCLKCGIARFAGSETIFWQGRAFPDRVFADLDGKAFKAYYCETCADFLLRLKIQGLIQGAFRYCAEQG